jgi:hypothetical protein
LKLKEKKRKKKEKEKYPLRAMFVPLSINPIVSKMNQSLVTFNVHPLGH